MESLSTTTGRILLLDPTGGAEWASLLEAANLRVFVEREFKTAEALVARESCQALVARQTHNGFPGPVLEGLARLAERLPVVMCGHCEPHQMTPSVFAYVPGNSPPEVLVRTIVRALEYGRFAGYASPSWNGAERRSAWKPSSRPLKAPPHAPPLAALVGQSRTILEIREMIRQAAPTDMTILVVGESGTGKEIVSRLIHEMSPRAENSFVKVNCPAIPESLFESELFGYEAGAFTGAQKRKLGRMELAASGTVFLDEIGEISPMMQAKLLQVIEQKQFCRLGGNQTVHVNARLIAATNAPLARMIQLGQFRSDLYFRLNQYVIHLPALRERTEDIPLLVDHFLNKYALAFEKPRQRLSADTTALLMGCPWRGNVRELESVIRSYSLTGREEAVVEAAREQTQDTPSESREKRIRQVERSAILSTLVQVRWNRRRAAEILGMSYNTLRRRIAQYKLEECAPPAIHGEAQFALEEAL